jgi:hypothetical protein
MKPRAKQSVTQQYLALGIFGIQTTADVNADTSVPDVSGDFEVWDAFTSTVASGRADVWYQGQLDESQSRISEIKVPVKGSSGAQYRLRVYVEAASPPHTEAYDSTLTSAPTTRTVLTVSSFSAQPAGGKRYHVLVEAHIDSGEALYVGRPVVKQE